VGLSFHLPSSADGLCTNAMQTNQLKIWINEFLQNAAFPVAVLALACAPEVSGVRTHRFTDQVRAVKPQIGHIEPVNREGWYQPTKSSALKQNAGN
jgi:hypothetical protein